MDHAPTALDILVRQAQQGQTHSLDQLCLDLLPVIQGVARRMLRCPDAIEDITQEVLLRVVLNLPDLQHQDRVEAWVRQCTRNLARDWHRRHNTLTRLLEMAAPQYVERTGHAMDTVTNQAVAREESSRLDSVLCGLSPEDLNLVRLHYGDGLSHRQIARHIGRHHSSIQERLRTIENRLKSQWPAPVPSSPGATTAQSPARIPTLVPVLAICSALSLESRLVLAKAAPAVLSSPSPWWLGSSIPLLGGIFTMKAVTSVAAVAVVVAAIFLTRLILTPHTPLPPPLPPVTGTYQPGQVLRTTIALGKTQRYKVADSPTGVQDIVLTATADGRLEFQVHRDQQPATQRTLPSATASAQPPPGSPALPTDTWVNWRRVSGDRAAVEALHINPKDQNLEVTLEFGVSAGSVNHNSDLLPTDEGLRTRVETLAKVLKARRPATP